MRHLYQARHSRRGSLDPLLAGRCDLAIAAVAFSCAMVAVALAILLGQLLPPPRTAEVQQADPLDFDTTPTSLAKGWRVVGHSIEGRPIEMTTFGTGRLRVLVVGGVHGSEYGSRVTSAFAEFLSAHPSAVPSSVTVDVLPCLDPDGAAMGSRGNARGVNLNRNFPSREWRPETADGLSAGTQPASEPETRLMMEVLASGYARVVSLHSRGLIVDYDGPGGAALAQAIAQRCGYPTGRLAEEGHFTGSMGEYVPERYHIPIVTLELGSPQLTSGVRDGLLQALR